MKALVVYDSVFGNTEQIAQAMGDALRPRMEVEVRRVGDVTPGQLTGVTLLIVGSPTRAFSPTPAAKKYLGSIPANALQGVVVAGFDTRISAEDTGPRILSVMVKLFGWAAKPIADRLQKKGGTLGAPPEGFYVKGSEGPLADGELERAARWAEGVADAAPA